jgi:ABC-type lipoprotein export system ATPase subunit
MGMERDRVLSYQDTEMSPEQRANTALASKKVSDALVLLFLEDTGHLDLNILFNAVINAVCQISVKCSATPENHDALMAKVVEGVYSLTEMQINDWVETKNTVEQSAQISYASLVNLSFDYRKAQN